MVVNEETRCVFVMTNKDTSFGLLLDKDDSVSVFKDKICREHEKCFPSFGKISISALKVKLGDQCYHLPDSMILSHALQPVSNNASFLSVDVTRVEEKAGELLTEIAASSKPDPTLKTHEPQEKPKKRKSITLATRPIAPTATENVPTDETYQTTDAEIQGVIVRVDAMQNETEIGTKDIVEQPVKPKKKRRTKKVKVPFQKDAQVASTSSHNVEPPQVIEDPLDKLVKKIVEEAS